MQLLSKKAETTITDNSKYLFKSVGTVTNMHADFKLNEQYKDAKKKFAATKLL